MKSWELRKAEAGNSDLVLHVEGICLSITWCNYRRQRYGWSAENFRYSSVVSVPSPLCLTCMSTHPTCHKRDRSENVLSTLQEQVIKLQAQMEKKIQLLKNIFFHLKTICTRTCKCYFRTLQTCVSLAMWVLKVMVNDLHQKSCSSESSHDGHRHAVRMRSCYSSGYAKLDYQRKFVCEQRRTLPM